jgi:hypothetical protein
MDEPERAPSSRGESEAEPETVEQTIVLAVTEAVEKLESDSLETARYPYFAPRRLGATAPHDCRIWRVDYRDTPSARSAPEFDPAELRTLDDPSTLSGLKHLLDAGLSVEPLERRRIR